MSGIETVDRKAYNSMTSYPISLQIVAWHIYPAVQTF